MSQRVALITGAGGEVGRTLIPALLDRGFEIVALDLAPLPDDVRAQCLDTVEMNILETDRMRALVRKYAPLRVFHLAAILSSHAERDYRQAHRVNVGGTLELLEICREEADPAVRFLFPSSIAVYGLPDVETKTAEGALREWQWTDPAGVYGCNKLYCELMGSYLSGRSSADEPALDFRSIRYPGLISAETLPSGGTTDFAPEMIHAAAQGKPYDCFVREDSRLPFMTMPDAVRAILALSEVEPHRMTTRIYNTRGFSCSAGELRSQVLERFPAARIGFASDAARQAIVDSWPADVDDSRARRDWDFAPVHDLRRAFDDYLTPAMTRRYAGVTGS